MLDNDALARQPGRLSPKRFPCDFGAGEVRYSHLGSAAVAGSSPAAAALRRAGRGGRAPLVLEVEVVFTQLEVVTRNLPLVVEELLGTSSSPWAQQRAWICLPNLRPVSRGHPVWFGAAAYFWGTSSLPAGPGPAGDTQEPLLMDCKAFQGAGASAAPSRSPEQGLGAHGGGAAILVSCGQPSFEREHFQVLVRIRGAENTAPKPSFVAMMMMEVDQFVLTALTPDMLAAEDAEVPQTC